MIQMKITTRLIACAMLTLGFGALVGCGDDETKGKGPVKIVENNANNQSDMGGVDMDAPQAFSGPHYITVAVDPSRAVYAPGNLLQLTHQIFDTRGMLTSTQDVEWSVTPAEAATLGADGKDWTLGPVEGEVVFKACAKEAGKDGGQVCGEANIIIDAQPPTIELTSPVPGQELSAADGALIQIAGKVTDTHGELVALVNGQRVELDATGAFSAQMKPQFGINHISVEATDGFSRQPSKLELDVLWAPEYLETEPTQDEAAVTMPDGLVLRLGQNFMDDRIAPATSLEGATLTEDLADILTLLLRYIDIASLIPNPVLDSTDVKLDITNASLGDPKLRIDITEDGMELFLRSSDVRIDTAGQLTLVDQTLTLNGTVTASVAILAKIKIEKPSPEEPFKVEIVELGVAIEDANSAFGDAQANAIFTLAQSALRGNIERVLTDALTMSFLDAVPALLEGALNSLESGLAMQSFPLDTGLGAPIQIDFRGKVEALNIMPLDSINMRLSARLAAQSAPVQDSRGVALMVPFAQDQVPFFDSSRIQIGIRLAMLNGLLHELWRAGLLNLDVSQILPDGLTSLVQSAVITGRIAPIMAPPTKGEPFDLILSVGQLELEADFGADKVKYGVAMSAGLNASVVNDQLLVSISDKPEIKTWIISSTTTRPRLNADQLRALLLSQVWPKLTEAIGAGLMLNLPVLDLSSLGTYAPSLANFSLSFVQVRPLVVRDEFLIIDSNLRGLLPPMVP